MIPREIAEVVAEFKALVLETWAVRDELYRMMEELRGLVEVVNRQQPPKSSSGRAALKLVKGDTDSAG